MKDTYSIFVGRLKMERILEISRCRWEGNIKTDRKYL
jgi:hypothetical protein